MRSFTATLALVVLGLLGLACGNPEAQGGPTAAGGSGAGGAGGGAGGAGGAGGGAPPGDCGRHADCPAAFPWCDTSGAASRCVGCLEDRHCGAGELCDPRDQRCEIPGGGGSGGAPAPRCGDGAVDAGETCDDGNTAAGDGCRADCEGLEVCGDGRLDVAEVCDDGNIASRDGCRADCSGVEVCGDGLLDDGELCDDGNVVSGDGCSADCTSSGTCGDGTLDPGEVCDDGNARSGDACRGDCRGRETCGDGLLDVGEACDDGNVASGDGCRSDCAGVELCGDGQLDALEACDDGNGRSADGCRGDCAGLELCGDGLLDVGEACDDGNTSSGDGCRGDCAGHEVCGDGQLDAAEACDDGNARAGDGCRGDCRGLERCGDGLLDSGETCDDGNAIGGDGCRADCAGSEVCGDGLVDQGEECDDGNGLLCDGCEGCQDRTALGVPLLGYARIPTVAALSVNGDACYELWARSSGGPADVFLLTASTNNTSSNFVLSCVNGQLLRFNVENGAGARWTEASVGCGDGLWHHVAGCRRDLGANVQLDLFYDGALVSTAATAKSNVGGAAAVYTGGWSGVQPGIDGAVDEIRISSTLRYAANFVPARRHVSDASTVLLLHLDEGAGAVAADASGNGHDAALFGTSWLADTGYAAGYCGAIGCGSGVVDPGEVCDDGNTRSGDGCRADCQGRELCGDGLLDSGEACDDGNTVSGDGCRGDCAGRELCGDGLLDVGEVCDDGNGRSGDGCRVDCRGRELCGDGLLDVAEACDDGNTSSGDGCRADCSGAEVCGDGLLDAGEECDDGNGLVCDGCEGCRNRMNLYVPAGAYLSSSTASAALSVNGDACYELWAGSSGSLADAFLLTASASNTSSNFVLSCMNGQALRLGVENGAGARWAEANVGCGDGFWHHVAGCRADLGANVRLDLFYDGVLVATTTTAKSNVGIGAAVYSGGWTNVQPGIDGAVDEIRISSTLRYAGNFIPARRHAADASTALLLHLDEGAGATGLDSSGNGHDATLSGTSWVADTGFTVQQCGP